MTISSFTAARASFASAFAMAGALFATSTSAQVVETATLTNSYNYTVGSQSGSNSNAANNFSLFLSDSTGGFASDLGLQVTSSLNQGSFSFLQNGYCVGDCSLSVTTDISFTLTNMGTAPAALRFDSLITPGHLGQSNIGGTSRNQLGNFLFTVRQDSTLLYQADGLNSARPPFVETSDNQPFNNMITNTNLPGWNVLDWSATPLSIDLLTIGAGQSTTLTYHSSLTVATTDAACLDTTQCLGYQVAFGDPRSRGGTTLDSFGRSAFDTSLSAFAAASSPAVGAAFAPYTVTYAFVPQGSPLPAPPLPEPPQDYDIPYGGGAVPEPATWALMLMGFAAIGSAIRRRRDERRTPQPA